MPRRLHLAIILTLLTGTLVSAELHREYTAPVRATDWLTAGGELLGVKGKTAVYLQMASGLQKVFQHSELADVKLSESGEYLVAATHEALLSPDQKKLSSEYVVLDRSGEIHYRAAQIINADEKRFQAAVSDDGLLALVDPLFLYLRLYQDGGVISEGQLFKLEGVRSLERKIRLWWHNDFLYLLVERPSLDSYAPDTVLLIKVHRDGRRQTVNELPFSYLLDAANVENQLFVSGYDYDPREQKMKPMIIALAPDGGVLWNHAHFGHELVLSEDDRYLAALRSDTEIAVFDLENERWRRYAHDVPESTYLGIAVDNAGEPSACLVHKKFFVRRQVADIQIDFPAKAVRGTVTMDPGHPGMIRIFCNGARHYVGTQHEWLEVRP